MPRDLEPQQLSSAMAKDQKRKQKIKGQRRNDTQINCGDCFSVISKKCRPALRRWLRRSNHVFRDRRLSNFESEHQKLAMDPRCAPQRVFLTHPSDEIAQLTIDLWPPCPPSGFQRQKAWKPARCHRRIVSGFTTCDKSSRLGQIRVIHTNNARSLPCSRRRGGARRKAILS